MKIKKINKEINYEINSYGWKIGFFK